MLPPVPHDEFISGLKVQREPFTSMAREGSRTECLHVFKDQPSQHLHDRKETYPKDRDSCYILCILRRVKKRQQSNRIRSTGWGEKCPGSGKRKADCRMRQLFTATSGYAFSWQLHALAQQRKQRANGKTKILSENESKYANMNPR